ncbi:EcsC family protein [Paracoccaceae bacterium Fryx2]|nr:EcsC family protein [Paracoccaceae bacterium Fryx2]
MAASASSPGVQPWTDAAETEIAGIATRYRRASGLLMKTIMYFGGKAENLLERLPDAAKDRIEEVTAQALHWSYDRAATLSDDPRMPRLGPWANRVAVTATGAAGGFGGLPAALVELPVTVTTMFGAIRKVAVMHGFDPQDDEIRLECIRVFGSGGPLAEDDGVETTFFGSRIAINGATVKAAISAVAPRFAAVIGQKLASQTLPVLGAVAGAGVNYTFISYYEEMAHVRFALRRMALTLGPERVNAAFRASTARRPVRRRPPRS